MWTYEVNSSLRIKFTVPSDMRMFTDLYSETLQKKPCLIFPGQEDKVSRGQSDNLYQYFKSSLSGKCLFVGYSFRHEVFNEPILDALQDYRIKKLGILDPHAYEAADRLLNGEKKLSDRIVPIEASFGEREAIDKIAVKWFSEVEGFNISGAPLLNDTLIWRKKSTEIY